VMSVAKPDLFLKALIVLPEAAVIAFHTNEGMLYVTDDYATGSAIVSSPR